MNKFMMKKLKEKKREQLEIKSVIVIQSVFIKVKEKNTTIKLSQEILIYLLDNTENI